MFICTIWRQRLCVWHGHWSVSLYVHVQMPHPPAVCPPVSFRAAAVSWCPSLRTGTFLLLQCSAAGWGKRTSLCRGQELPAVTFTGQHRQARAQGWSGDPSINQQDMWSKLYSGICHDVMLLQIYWPAPVDWREECNWAGKDITVSPFITSHDKSDHWLLIRQVETEKHWTHS